MKTFNRFFSFGCSWTDFLWPTWADIVSWDLGIPFENWGRSGSCNQYIFSKVIECNLQNQFNKDDLIVIVWTGWYRESRFYKGSWNVGGSVFNNKHYDDKWIKSYWDFDWDIIRNNSFIYATNQSFKDLISYQAIINEPPAGDVNSKIYDFYVKHVPPPPRFQFSTNRRYSNNCIDAHPDILSHLEFVEKQLYPSLNLGPVKKETKTKCVAIYKSLSKVLSPNDTWVELDSKVKKCLSTEFNFQKHKHYGL